ncbi:GumC family protein [Novosphingobium resinovorum]|uniref:non-specific protein-tyrosine kinase n=1 Tax=Novosphingobium resinovorum TaxID=158500 RepID=A0A1D8A5J9_9SPHN|nr:polysaccharide biosynthesis tyrosine autokinase [Novosphingobium resinovorum]AOR77380.1 hypothetical protein BES08_11940 [Novosphingobium resinovorum]
MATVHPAEESQWEGEGHTRQGTAVVEENGILGIDLQRVVVLIRRNIVVIGAIVVGCLILGIIATLLRSPLYTTNSSVLVEDSAAPIIQNSDLQPVNSASDTERFIQTQIEVISSRQLALQVVDRLKLADNEGLYENVGAGMPQLDDLPGRPDKKALSKHRREAAATLLSKSLVVMSPADTRVINISFTSRSPAFSAEVADAFAEAFMQSGLDRKFQSSAYARTFLRDQLQDARVRLQQSEQDLNRYASAAGLIRQSGVVDGNASESALSITNETLVQLNTALATATVERIAAQNRWESIANEKITNIPEVLGNTTVAQLLRDSASLEAQLAQERAKHLEDYPSVQALSAQVRELNGRIQAVGNSIKRSVGLNFEVAKQKEDTLKAQVAELQGAAIHEQDRGVQYQLLKRVADTNRATYDALLQRYNELSVSAGSLSNNISIIDRAKIPTQPSSPNLPLNILVSLLAGLGIAAIYVIVRDYFDDTIRSPDDVEAKFGLPLLGLIPREADIDNAMSNSRSSLVESYRSLVTNMMYSLPGGLPQVLAVTSATESVGKSTTCQVVASDIASLGKRVLLIDADLRRPTAHKRIIDANEQGLTAILANVASFDQVVQRSGVEHLDVLTALPMNQQPSQLLAGPRLHLLMEEVRAKYDCVIVDCPPMLGLSDSAMIANHVDAVLMVVSSDGFRRGAVKGALRRLNLVRAKVAGMVLTKFDPQSADGEYAYYGYQYYSYGSHSES